MAIHHLAAPKLVSIAQTNGILRSTFEFHPRPVAVEYFRQADGTKEARLNVLCVATILFTKLAGRAKCLSVPRYSAVLTGLLVFSAREALASSPTNIFDPAATPAHSIFSLSMLVLSVTLAIFLIVGGLLLYALIRFRHRPSDSDHEPAQIYGSNQIEPVSYTHLTLPNDLLCVDLGGRR